MKCRAWVAALALLVLVGCANWEAAMPQSGKPEVTLKGLVAYRERMALPADAVVDVWIADILFASKDAVPLTNPLKPADIELLLVRQGSN